MDKGSESMVGQRSSMDSMSQRSSMDGVSHRGNLDSMDSMVTKGVSVVSGVVTDSCHGEGGVMQGGGVDGVVSNGGGMDSVG